MSPFESFSSGWREEPAHPALSRRFDPITGSLLGERHGLRAVDDFLDNLGGPDDRGALHQLLLSDPARLRARAAQPHPPAVVDELAVQITEHRQPRLRDPIGSILASRFDS
jgi:hypothetical protein